MLLFYVVFFFFFFVTLLIKIPRLKDPKPNVKRDLFIGENFALLFFFHKTMKTHMEKTYKLNEILQHIYVSHDPSKIY